MDKAKKKLLKKYIAWIALAALVVMLAAMPLIARREEEASGPQASILNATVQTGDITTYLHGGGVLEAGEPMEVTIPDGVMITEFLVKNGDMVTEGTPLAAVDKVTVMNAIVQVQETLEYIRGKMESAKDDTISQYITARAGGRIKVLYAAPGDDAREVMLEYGALAVVSVDDLMAVKLERQTDLRTGDTVAVTLSDGTEVSGRVESNLSGELVITVEDDGYAIGEEVSVVTEEGQHIGKGELYIRNAWAVTAFSGTIQSVSVREEGVIYAGSTLFTMTDRDYTAEMETLSKLHRDYEELLQELFIMYRDGVIAAPCDGMIAGVDENSPYLQEKIDYPWGEPQTEEETGIRNAAGGGTVTAMAATQSTGWKLVLLSDTPETPEPTPDPPGGGEGGGSEEPECTGDENCQGLVHKPGCPLSGVTVTTYTGWVAKVVDVWDGGAVMLRNPNAITTSNLTGMTVNESALTEQYTYGASTYSNGAAISPGDIVFLTKEGGILKIRGGSGGMGGFGGFSFGSYGGYGSGAAAQPFVMYELEGEVLITVIPQDTMILNITVDERDINRVSVGQTAQVQVDALRGETYTAEVTRVGIHGANSGGSSKFTVELKLPRQGNMLAGMHATAAITMETRTDVPVIPVAALAEVGAETVVYTGYDETNDVLTDPVPVTLGLSDGENVQILSGLEAGDDFFYSYYDTVEVSTEVENDRFSFR